MGCVQSKESATSTQDNTQSTIKSNTKIPIENTTQHNAEDDIKLQRRQKEEAKIQLLQQKISTWYPPPFPTPVQLRTNIQTFDNETEYKKYMTRKHEYEYWENQVLLMARKMQKLSEEMWEVHRLLWIAKLKQDGLFASLPKEIVMEVIEYTTSGKLWDHYLILEQQAKKNAQLQNMKYYF